MKIDIPEIKNCFQWARKTKYALIVLIFISSKIKILLSKIFLFVYQKTQKHSNAL